MSDWLDRDKVIEWEQELSRHADVLASDHRELFTPELSYALHRAIDLLIDRREGVLLTREETLKAVNRTEAGVRYWIEEDLASGYDMPPYEDFADIWNSRADRVIRAGLGLDVYPENADDEEENDDGS